MKVIDKIKFFFKRKPVINSYQSKLREYTGDKDIIVSETNELYHVWFTRSALVSEFIQKRGINKNKVQSISGNQNDGFTLFYWRS